MKLSRRDFLKWASLSAFGAVACDIFREGEMVIQSSEQLPEDLVTGLDNRYATLCGQCPEREGILVRVMEGRAKKVQGNSIYPTNQGKQSARCEAGLQALYHPDRLAKPVSRVGARGSGVFQDIEWNAAMDTLRDRLGGLRDGGEADSMLLITEPLRGHLGKVVRGFTEAYGGRHLGFEPFEQSVLRAATRWAFDQDRLPNFDIENTRYLLSFGSDFLSTWVSPVRYARGYGQFRGQRGGTGRGTFVHIDPRYSMTAANADQWIPISPGTEGILALSMAYVIISGIISNELQGDLDVVRAMIGGTEMPDLESALGEFKPETVVSRIGMPATIHGVGSQQVIETIAREFAGTRPSLAIGGGEAGAHTNGLFNLSAIYALNYLSGSVGAKGGIVFNPPPPIDEIVGDVTKVETLGGWELIVNEIKDRRIKLLMVHGSNPVHGLPDRTGFREALGSDDIFIVSFSSFLDDTSRMADLVLPERSHMEDWGSDVPDPGPGYQMVGIQQPVVNPLPELDPRSFPDMLLTLSQELGLGDGLPETFEKVVREGSDELFGLGRGSPQGGSSEAPTASAFWNKLLQQGGWWDTNRVSSDSPPAPPSLAELARQESSPSFKGLTGENTFYLVPFLSNSLLDGRGAHLPWLQAAPDPLTTMTWQTWIEMNPRKAKDMGLKEGDVVTVESSEGTIEAIVYPHPAVPPNVVSIPIGQGHTPGLEYSTREGEKRGDNVISILATEKVAETGALAWAASRVHVQPTGRKVKVSKLEGLVTAFPIGTRAEDIVQVTSSTDA